MPPHYPLPNLLAGQLIQRYKRFLADIALSSGEVITAHCPNTGPMTGVCQVGAPVLVSHSPDPRRKLAYTWEMIQIADQWVGINTSLPNRLIRHGLEQAWFPELQGFETLKREVAYGDQRSKIDFLLTYPQGLAYLEVKNTTWTNQKQNAGSIDNPDPTRSASAKEPANPICALFPDTVTTRGQKHLEELMLMARQGHRAILLYLINRGDCAYFAPGLAKDRRYAELLAEAIAQGVEILPYRFEPSPEGWTFLGRAALLPPDQWEQVA